MPLDSLKASLILCNVPSTNSDAARRFYATLLGVDVDDFARGLNDEVESYFVPISDDGVDLTVTQRFVDEERLTCYFAVEDLKGTVEQLSESSGKVVVEPRAVKVGGDRARRYYEEAAKRAGLKAGDTVGTMAVLLDPDGNHVGLMQLEEFAQAHFKVGRFAQKLSDDRLQEHASAREAGGEV